VSLITKTKLGLSSIMWLFYVFFFKMVDVGNLDVDLMVTLCCFSFGGVG
jgi:hypothetical protein